MAKEQYKRRHVQGTLMREVIFRIDYTGVVDVNDIVKNFISNFKDLFKDYKSTYSNRLDLGNLNYQEISETLSVPVKEIERQEIHRFTGNTFTPDDAIFDISKYYTFLHIIVKDYRGLDPYLDFFVRFLGFIKEQSPFISFKRFGLRKTGAAVFFSHDAIFNIFERQYFCTEFEGGLFQKESRQYSDALRSEDKRFAFTFKRVVDKGFAPNPENQVVEAYQATIDIDGFLDEEAIERSAFNEPGSVKAIIEGLNENLFELFKLGVTEDYLKAPKNEPDKQ